MGWNLPPGCNVGDIPGNRSRDYDWDAYLEYAERENEDPTEPNFREWLRNLEEDDRNDPR